MNEHAARALPFAPRGPLILLGVYLVAMLVQAALLAPSGRSDDLETLLLAQSLEWGYQAKNPPGFYWLAHAVMTATGPSLPVVYALRLGGMFAMVAGLYALARRVQPDPLLAACAGFGVLATLHFHWYLMFYLTNTTLALALAPAVVLAALNVRERGTVGAYALLGLAVGLGVLARYNFLLLVVALAGRRCRCRQWRALVLRRRMLVAVAVAAALVAPHAVWLIGHAGVLSGHAGAQLVGAAPYAAASPRGSPAWSRRPRASSRCRSGCWPSSASGGLPPGAGARPGPRRRAGADRPDAGDRARAGRGLRAGRASYVRPHHLFFLILVPVWLIGRLDRAALRRWAAPAFAGPSPPAAWRRPSPSRSRPGATRPHATPARSSSRWRPMPARCARPASSAAPSSRCRGGRTSRPRRCARPSRTRGSSPSTSRSTRRRPTPRPATA